MLCSQEFSLCPCLYVKLHKKKTMVGEYTGKASFPCATECSIYYVQLGHNGVQRHTCTCIY